MTQEAPIFIGGLAHSGKTPLRLFLSRHPNLVLTRQTYMWNRFYNRFGDLSDPQNLERCLAGMLKTKGIQALQPDVARIRVEFGEGAGGYGRLFSIFHQHHAERLGKSRWGDQLGFVERFAEPIFAAYPQAKMIHMVRDPRDRQGVGKDFSRQRKGKMGWEMGRWLHSADLIQRNQHRYPEQYKVVRYETFCANPEATLREICLFLGEDFVPEMLTDDAIQLDKGDKGQFGIQIEKVGNGRLSDRDLLFTQTYAAKHMSAFNYALESPHLSFGDRLLFYLIDWPINRLGMAAWYLTEAKSHTNYSRN